MDACCVCIIGFRWGSLSLEPHVNTPSPHLTFWEGFASSPHEESRNHANPPVQLLPPSLPPSLSLSLMSPLSLAYLSLPSLTGMNCHTTAMDDPMIAIHTTLTALGTLTK